MLPRIMFFEIQNWFKWLDFMVGKLPRILSFYIFFTDARLNNPTLTTQMGLKFMKRKCAHGSSFVKIIWTPLSMKMSTTLKVRSPGNQRSTVCRS